MRVVMGLCTTPQWNLDTCVFRQCGAEAVDAFFFHPRAEHSVIVASGCAVRWNIGIAQVSRAPPPWEPTALKEPRKVRVLLERRRSP